MLKKVNKLPETFSKMQKVEHISTKIKQNTIVKINCSLCKNYVENTDRFSIGLYIIIG
jgi:hypothetical protein